MTFTNSSKLISLNLTYNQMRGAIFENRGALFHNFFYLFKVTVKRYLSAQIVKKPAQNINVRSP